MWNLFNGAILWHPLNSRESATLIHSSHSPRPIIVRAVTDYKINTILLFYFYYIQYFFFFSICIILDFVFFILLIFYFLLFVFYSTDSPCRPTTFPPQESWIPTRPASLCCSSNSNSNSNTFRLPPRVHSNFLSIRTRSLLTPSKRLLPSFHSSIPLVPCRCRQALPVEL